MAEKSIKVDTDIHKSVVEHTTTTGQKIGKFYDIAAQEKIERERKKEKVQFDKNGNRL